MKLAVLLLWTTWTADAARVYKLLRDYHVTSPINSTIPCGNFCRKTCINHCGCDVTCASLSVNQQLQICHLHSRYIYDEESEYSQEVGWEYHQLRSETVKKGDWTMVFRVTANVGQTSMSTWTNTGHHDDPANMDGVPPGCQTVNASKPCDRHFRSKILDDWESYNIQEVKVEVYKNGVAQQNIIFDGTGSDITSWFDKSKILNSTWTGLTSATYVFFTLDGFSGRKFYIMKTHGGCSSDNGLLSVVDSSQGCAWENSAVTGTPTILFSSADSFSSAGSFDVADVFAVFVKIG